MTPAVLVLRILAAFILPPVGIIGLKGVGCGTFALMFVLTLFFWFPGQIAAIILIVKEYSTSSGT